MPTEAEWLTRKSRIDTRLKQKGWQLVRFTPDLDLKALDKSAVEELPTANGPADYALFVKGQLLGIIEAKKVTVNPKTSSSRQSDTPGACSLQRVNGMGCASLFSTQATERWFGMWMPALENSSPVN